MLAHRRIPALAVALSLALPAGALAQGAGDAQYQDPFAGEGSGNGSGGGSGNGGGGSGNGSSASGNPRLSDTMPGAQGGAEGSQRLPRTGADPGLIALLGAGFLITGAGLRVRVRRPLA